MIDHNERAAEARALRHAAADVRSMHDPVASDCEEWAAWLEARAARIEQAASSGGTPPDSPEANARAQAEGQTIALASVQPPTREQIDTAVGAVPTTDEPFTDRDEAWQAWPGTEHSEREPHKALHDAFNAGWDAAQPSPHPPTREQIAEAIYDTEGHPRVEWSALPQSTKDAYLGYADAVLALFQNGAER